MALLLPLLPWRKNAVGLGEAQVPFKKLPVTFETSSDHVETLLYDNWNPWNCGLDHATVAMIAVFAGAFVLNFSLVTLFFMFEGVRSVPSNQFIGALSISNCLICGHLLLFNLLLDPFNGPGPMCDFIVYGGVIFCAASNISRCAIAIDRYIFISDPLRYYQRSQSMCRGFVFCSSFVITIVLVVTPYVFIIREEHSLKNCLPAYPLVYLACVTILLSIVPGLILFFIYTRIFYWAFLQMQILRQEARQFMGVQKQSHNYEPSRKPSPHSSVTSKQLRLYTGAAMFLTPNSPFSSNRQSLEMKMPDGENSSLPFETAIHSIVHILAGLKDHESVLSTSVDKAGRKSNPGTSDNNKNAVNGIRGDGLLEGVVSRATDGRDKIKITAAGVGGGAGSEAVHTSGATREFESHGSGKTNKNQSARAVHGGKYGSRIDPQPYRKDVKITTPEESMTVTSQNPSSVALDAAIDDVLSSWTTGSSVNPERLAYGATTHRATRGYVPVTPQGRWIEEQLRNYDVEVVKGSDASSVSQKLLRRLFCAELKAAVMIMALMGVFLVCWVPFFVVELIEVFELGTVSTTERTISISLIAINCLLDPFTYAVMNPPFRTIVKRSMGTVVRRFRERDPERLICARTASPTKKLAFKYTMKEKVPGSSNNYWDELKSTSV